MRRWVGIPGLWVGIPCLGWGFLVKRTVRHDGFWFRLGRREGNPQRLSLGENEARSNAPFPSPYDRSDQPQSPVECPAGEGLKHSNRRTVQRAKDLNTPTRWTGPGTEGYINSAWSGPRCLQRATSNPQRQHSLLSDPSRERIRSVRSYPGNRDRAPKISMVGNPGKAKQHGHYHSLRSIKRGLAAPPRRFSPKC